MKNDKENRFNYSIGVLLLVLFFFFIANISPKPNQYINSSHNIELRIHHLSLDNGVSNVQSFTFNKYLISVLDFSKIKLHSFNYFLVNTNRKLGQKYISTKRNEIIIRPIIIRQLLFYYYFSDIETPPVIS